MLRTFLSFAAIVLNPLVILGQTSASASPPTVSDSSADAAQKKEDLIWVQIPELRKAAESGDVDATVELIRKLQNNPSEEKLTEMVKWARTLAEKGHAESQFLMCRIYFEGIEPIGIQRNRQESEKWVYRAWQTNPAYIVQALQFYATAELGNPKYKEETLDALWKYAEEMKRPDAQLLAANLLMSDKVIPKDLPRAVSLLQQAAESGFPMAMSSLAKCYLDGQGTKPNTELAAEWYKKAAELGDIEGKFRYAQLLIEGKGVPRDHREAAALLKSIESKGIEEATFAYAKLLQTGDNAVQNPQEAFEILKRLRNRNYGPAAYELGVACRDGIGTNVDLAAAARHFSDAKFFKTPGADKAYEEVYAKKLKEGSVVFNHELNAEYSSRWEDGRHYEKYSYTGKANDVIKVRLQGAVNRNSDDFFDVSRSGHEHVTLYFDCGKGLEKAKSSSKGFETSVTLEKAGTCTFYVCSSEAGKTGAYNVSFNTTTREAPAPLYYYESAQKDLKKGYKYTEKIELDVKGWPVYVRVESSAFKPILEQACMISGLRTVGRKDSDVDAHSYATRELDPKDSMHYEIVVRSGSESGGTYRLIIGFPHLLSVQ